MSDTAISAIAVASTLLGVLIGFTLYFRHEFGYWPWRNR